MASSGNFAVWNSRELGSYLSLSNASTKVLGNTSTDASGVNTNMAVSSGKWYIEFRLVVSGSSYPYISLGSGTNAQDFNSTTGYNGEIRFHAPNSTSMNDNTSSGNMDIDNWGTVTLTETGTTACNNGDVVGFALDLDNKKLFISRNGTFYNSGDPANGTNPQASWTTNPPEVFINCFTYTSSRGCVINAGQDSTFGGGVSAGGNSDVNGFGDFKYSVPANFLAMCSANMPVNDDIDPAQTDTEHALKNYNAILYTGNSSTNAISGLGFRPDLVWFMGRTQTAAYSQGLINSTRGASLGLYSDRNNAETNFSSDFASFDSDGFTLNAGSSANINNSGKTFVAWCWRANSGTTSSNGNGSITSTVQSNPAGTFSIVKYTGTGSNATVGHGLSSAPAFILFKRLSGGSENWQVYHAGIGAEKYLVLNAYNGQSTSSTRFNDTEPTSTVFSIGTESGVNTSSADHIAFCWSNVDGMQRFGRYEGNNQDNNGPFIFTGFRPRILAIKGADEDYGWYVFDSVRNTNNLVDRQVSWYPGGGESEEPTGARKVDFYSNGFKVMASAASINGANDTYVYMCWGDTPAKYNNAF